MNEINVKTLWTEDDATTSDPDHETIRMAWKRLFDEDFDVVKEQSGVLKIDHGDADEYRFPDGRIALATYPGNSVIMRRE